MSLIYIGFTIVPIINVESPFVFALKIVAVVMVANGLGAVVYLIGQNRANSGSLEHG